MQEAINSFLVIVQGVAPYSIAWALGTRAFNFIVGAMTGKDVSI